MTHSIKGEVFLEHWVNFSCMFCLSLSVALTYFSGNWTYVSWVTVYYYPRHRSKVVLFPGECVCSLLTFRFDWSVIMNTCIIMHLIEVCVCLSTPWRDNYCKYLLGGYVDWTKISHEFTCQGHLLRSFLIASLYFSKRGAYWDRLCRDVVGHWLVGRWLSRACTVAKRCILGL